MTSTTKTKGACPSVLPDGTPTFRGDGRIPRVKEDLLIERVKRHVAARWPRMTVVAEPWGRKGENGLKLSAVLNVGKRKPPVVLLVSTWTEGDLAGKASAKQLSDGFLGNLNRAIQARAAFPDDDE